MAKFVRPKYLPENKAYFQRKNRRYYNITESSLTRIKSLMCSWDYEVSNVQHAPSFIIYTIEKVQ